MADPKHVDEIQGAIIHEYDGIYEADNELPRWWLAIFYLTTIFAIGYWFYYEEFRAGPSAAEEYAAKMAEAAAKSGDNWEDLWTEGNQNNSLASNKVSSSVE